MESWLHECNFDASGAYVPRSSSTTPQRHDRVAALQLDTSTQSPLSTSLSSPLTPRTPTLASTATPTELHAPSSAAAVAVPSCEAYLRIPPAFVFQHAHSRTDAALLYEVTCAAIEVDVLLESVCEQLLDSERICSYLRADADKQHQQLQQRQSDVMATALVALQQQAQSINERGLTLLLERLQQCLTKLFDLQFPLIQSIESNDASARELEALGSTDVATKRWALVDVERALLHRLEALHATASIPLATALVPPSTQLLQHFDQSCVWWPAASGSANSEQRATMEEDVQLSSSSSGSMPSLSFSAVASPLSTTTTQLLRDERTDEDDNRMTSLAADDAVDREQASAQRVDVTRTDALVASSDQATRATDSSNNSNCSSSHARSDSIN